MLIIDGSKPNSSKRIRVSSRLLVCVCVYSGGLTPNPTLSCLLSRRRAWLGKQNTTGRISPRCCGWPTKRWTNIREFYTCIYLFVLFINLYIYIIHLFTTGRISPRCFGWPMKKWTNIRELCIYIYIYIYVYIYKCIYIYIYIYIHLYIYIYIIHLSTTGRICPRCCGWPTKRWTNICELFINMDIEIAIEIDIYRDRYVYLYIYIYKHIYNVSRLAASGGRRRDGRTSVSYL